MTHLADLYPRLGHSPHNEALRVVDHEIHQSLDEERRTKLCIYGAGRGRNEAPLDDPEWEVWSLNLIIPFDSQHRLRADVWFDLHQRVAQSADDLRWMRMCPFPLYVPPDLEDVSVRSVHFPLGELEQQFGAYWANSFAYMIALALRMNCFSDLGLYGLEMAWGTLRERTVEWACVAYWLGRAEERGLMIHLPSNSTLGTHCGRYGFEYAKEKKAVEEYTEGMKHMLPDVDVGSPTEDMTVGLVEED